jgi:hypothetical protein
MNCPYCQFDEDDQNLHCTDCGEPFYRFDVKSDAYYFDLSGEVNIPVSITNNSVEPITLGVVMYREKYREHQTQPINEVIQNGRTKEVNVSFKGLHETVVGDLLFSLSINNFLREIRPRNYASVTLYPKPNITTSLKNVELDPTNGYSFQVPLTLENECYVRIELVQVFKKGYPLLKKNLDLVLSGEGSSIELDLDIDPDEISPGEHNISIWLMLRGMIIRLR